jgi:isocitrate dehydrogenase kinase/phosphatase
VAANDVFPEEFGHFLLGNPSVRAIFEAHHGELLRADFWRDRQARIRSGEFEDVFPYPTHLRFAHRFPLPESTGA